MPHVNRKRIDRLGCFYDAKMEAIDEARYETHVSEHESYPQSWCAWCEEEQEAEQKEVVRRPNGIAETIRRLRWYRKLDRKANRLKNEMQN